MKPARTKKPRTLVEIVERSALDRARAWKQSGEALRAELLDRLAQLKAETAEVEQLLVELGQGGRCIRCSRVHYGKAAICAGCKTEIDSLPNQPPPEAPATGTN